MTGRAAAVHVEIKRPTGDAIDVRISGRAEGGVVTELTAALAAVHAEAVRHHVALVEVDLRDVERMSSAGFGALTAWIASVQELPSQIQYRIRVRARRGVEWQRRGLHALRCFAADFVTVVG
ncbi:MAG TPA: hypothetical protein VHB21_06600 [Minicystis sp.]|nr:hypothetical protein [Minicystis sp.]